MWPRRVDASGLFCFKALVFRWLRYCRNKNIKISCLLCYGITKRIYLYNTKQAARHYSQTKIKIMFTINGVNQAFVIESVSNDTVFFIRSDIFGRLLDDKIQTMSCIEFCSIGMKIYHIEEV